MLPAFAAGTACGLAVALLMGAVETSRLAIGPLAFYGNGALVVPAVAIPVALYALWAWAVRAARPVALAVAAVAGLEAGFALGVALTVGNFPGSLGSGALSGLLFVVVPAVIAGFVVTAARAIPEFARASTLFGLVVVSLPFMLLLPFVAMGVLAGAFVVASARAERAGSIALGALLGAVLSSGSVAIPLLLV
ncbi:MAG TPA: hypothetical protein VFM93_01355 [Candidatus Limnocylindria bacterium]|nr:hypothetical protein [Candidatus Limnocylindria bacterium]